MGQAKNGHNFIPTAHRAVVTILTSNHDLQTAVVYCALPIRPRCGVHQPTSCPFALILVTGLAAQHTAPEPRKTRNVSAQWFLVTLSSPDAVRLLGRRMVVLTAKEMFPPPPPYFAVEHAQSTLSLATSVIAGRSSARPVAPKLPSHITLQIVYKTLERKRMSEAESEEDRIRRTTRTLYWIGSNLRLVNRGFYLGEYYIQ